MSVGTARNIKAHDGCSENTLEMVRDEPIAAPDVEHLCARRKHSGKLEGHVVCSTDFAASSHPPEAALDGCAETDHRRGAVQTRCLKKCLRN
jgi:hypothetical protein